MSTLIVHPENHPRFGGYSIGTELSVELEDEAGWVRLSVELEEGEALRGPTRSGEGRIPTDRELLAGGEVLQRLLRPEEARALAAALVHFSDEHDRRWR